MTNRANIGEMFETLKEVMQMTETKYRGFTIHETSRGEFQIGMKFFKSLQAAKSWIDSINRNR